ncbi:MAG: hypothetical protein RM338_01385 [Nostoc sp. DedQUE12a]|nr:hypothetical protein [Nostoc sp. DedQUE12a]
MSNYLPTLENLRKIIKERQRSHCGGRVSRHKGGSALGAGNARLVRPWRSRSRSVSVRRRVATAVK